MTTGHVLNTQRRRFRTRRWVLVGLSALGAALLLNISISGEETATEALPTLPPGTFHLWMVSADDLPDLSGWAAHLQDLPGWLAQHPGGPRLVLDIQAASETPTQGLASGNWPSADQAHIMFTPVALDATGVLGALWMHFSMVEGADPPPWSGECAMRLWLPYEQPQPAFRIEYVTAAGEEPAGPSLWCVACFEKAPAARGEQQ